MTFEQKRMRTASLLGEAFRNVSVGTSRAVLLSAGTIVLVGLLTLFEALTIAGILHQAQAFRSSGASTIVVQDQNSVSGTACDALSKMKGVVAAGALRQRAETFNPVLLPDQGTLFFDGTPGLGKLLGASPPLPGSHGLLLEQALTSTLNVGPLSAIATDSGTAIVSSTYGYPDDGRNPELQDAAISVSRPIGLYDECWVKFWPPRRDYVNIMQTVIVGDTGGNAQFSQLNATLGADFDGTALFDQRLSRFTPLIAFVAELAMCFVIGRSRRLEYASARHMGLTRTQLALQIVIEHLMWLLPCGVFLISMAAVTAAYASNETYAEVLLPESAVIAAGLAGAVLGGVVASIVTRANDLFRYFKER